MNFNDHPDIPHRLLTAEEELSFADVIQGGRLDELKPGKKPTPEQQKAIDARNELVSHNLRLAMNVAKAYRAVHIPIKDLFQAGVIGLIRAAEDYKPRKFKVRFSTYASYWIRQQIATTLQGDHLLHIPRYIQTELNNLKKGDLKAGIESSVRASYLRFASKTCFQELVLDDGYSSVASLAGRPEGLSLDDREQLDYAMKFLTKREQEVISLRYGLGCHPERLRQVAERIGTTKQRVQQIEAIALGKMRRALTA